MVIESCCSDIEVDSIYGSNDHPHLVRGNATIVESVCSGSNDVMGTSEPPTTLIRNARETRTRMSKSSGHCTHITEEVNLGAGINGQDVVLNVSSCKDISPDYNKENDQGFCYSRKTIVHRINLPNGTRNVKSAKFCRDMRVTELKDTCKRFNTTEVYYMDTLKQFPISVNIGHCGGTCATGGSCKPTGYRNVAVHGPNGVKTVQVVTDCGCAGSCYRQSHYEMYRVTTEKGECIERNVDVGKCVGGCQDSCTKDFKAPWAPKPGVPYRPGSLPCQNPKCTASTYRYHRIEEAKIDIPVINECNCIVSGYIVD